MDEELRQAFEDWLLSMPWSPELITEQKEMIANAFAQAFAMDWLAGTFMGTAIPDERLLPDLWKDIAEGIVGLLPTDMPEPIAELHAEMFAKTLTLKRFVRDKPPELVRAYYNDAPEVARDGVDIVMTELRQNWPAKRFQDPYVRIS